MYYACFLWSGRWWEFWDYRTQVFPGKCSEAIPVILKLESNFPSFSTPGDFRKYLETFLIITPGVEGSATGI